jgi:hypothetical protein
MSSDLNNASNSKKASTNGNHNSGTNAGATSDLFSNGVNEPHAKYICNESKEKSLHQHHQQQQQQHSYNLRPRNKVKKDANNNNFEHVNLNLNLGQQTSRMSKSSRYVTEKQLVEDDYSAATEAAALGSRSGKLAMPPTAPGGCSLLNPYNNNSVLIEDAINAAGGGVGGGGGGGALKRGFDYVDAVDNDNEDEVVIIGSDAFASLARKSPSKKPKFVVTYGEMVEFFNLLKLDAINEFLKRDACCLISDRVNTNEFFFLHFATLK